MTSFRKKASVRCYWVEEHEYVYVYRRIFVLFHLYIYSILLYCQSCHYYQNPRDIRILRPIWNSWRKLMYSWWSRKWLWRGTSEQRFTMNCTNYIDDDNSKAFRPFSDLFVALCLRSHIKVKIMCRAQCWKNIIGTSEILERRWSWTKSDNYD